MREKDKILNVIVSPFLRPSPIKAEPKDEGQVKPEAKISPEKIIVEDLATFSIENEKPSTLAIKKQDSENVEANILTPVKVKLITFS